MKARLEPRINLEGRTPLETVIPLVTPFIIFADPASSCNFKCSFCPTGHRDLIAETGRFQGVMKYEVFQKIVDDLGEFDKPIKVLRMYKDGEPFLNKRLAEMVAYAKRSKHVEYIDTTTNGTLISPDRVGPVLEAGIDKINISVDGMNEETYAKFTGFKFDFKQFVENVKWLYDNKGNCEIVVKIPGELITETQRQQFFDTFGDHCDRIFVENFAPCWPEFDIEAHTGVKISKGIYQQKIGDTDTCPYIFYGYSVNADGLVSSCFLDWGRKLIIGDVRQQSMKEIWNSERMNALRLQHLEGRRRQNGVCGNCGQLSHCLPDSIDAHRLTLLKKFKALVPVDPDAEAPGGQQSQLPGRGSRMKVLHVTPHLGGGVGKAHAAMRGVLPAEVEQTFVLLEAPRDRRYLESIEYGGARVIVADSLEQVARLAGRADIVQFELWNYPRLFECLANCAFPAIRCVFWSHISGVRKPLIPPGLMEEAMRFVFTTRASLDNASLAVLSEAARSRLEVINSGFGLPGAERRVPMRDRKPAIAYLGTVDFVKMHPGFFDAIDRLADDDVRVSVWGAIEPSGPVAVRAQAMRHPERVEFRGETAEPAAALSDADIFFYPLQPDHYGTAENALIEAMALGLVPVVLNNAAEGAIIRDGETGFIARSIEESASLLQMLLSSADVRERVSRNAMDQIAETRTPDQSVRDFMIVWLGMLSKQPTYCDFRAAIGDSPADWFVATQCLPGATWKSPTGKGAQQPAKGTLAHFESVFEGDVSLARLRR